MSTVIPQYGAISIGNLRYSYDPNPDALVGGRPKSTAEHLEKLGGTTDFVYRFLQIIDKGFSSINHFFNRPELAKLSDKASMGTAAMLFPRVYCATKEMVDSFRAVDAVIASPDGTGEAQAPNSEQLRRRIVTAISRTTDAAAAVSVGVGLVAEHVLKTASGAQRAYTVGDGLGLIADTCEAQIAAENWNRARLAASDLAQVHNAPADLVNAAVYTQRLSLIQWAKSITSMALTILSLGSLALGVALVSGWVLGVMSLTVALLSVASMSYKQSMPSKPLDMFGYYNRSLAVTA